MLNNMKTNIRDFGTFELMSFFIHTNPCKQLKVIRMMHLGAQLKNKWTNVYI